jgi:hypothetical protein
MNPSNNGYQALYPAFGDKVRIRNSPIIGRIKGVKFTSDSILYKLEVLTGWPMKEFWAYKGELEII